MTNEQATFLKEEFDLGWEEFASLDQSGWNDIREKCAEIAISEYDEEDGEAILSERFLAAESITDISFKKLQEMISSN